MIWVFIYIDALLVNYPIKIKFFFDRNMACAFFLRKIAVIKPIGKETFIRINASSRVWKSCSTFLPLNSFFLKFVKAFF